MDLLKMSKIKHDTDHLLEWNSVFGRNLIQYSDYDMQFKIVTKYIHVV